MRALREGRTPDRRTLDRRQMPWPDLGRMSDDELGAIYFYLQTVSHVEEGNGSEALAGALDPDGTRRPGRGSAAIPV